MLKSLPKKVYKKATRVFIGVFSRRARFRARFGRNHNDITIISNNCIAGFLYKDFDIPYNLPTVGLQFTQEGFVRFIVILRVTLSFLLPNIPILQKSNLAAWVWIKSISL